MPDRHRRWRQARSAWNKVARRLRTACGLVWSAWPLGMLVMVALAVLTGLAPASQAWLTRILINSLVRHLTTANLGHVGVLAALIGVIGLIKGLSPQIKRYTDAKERRQLELTIQDRTYRAINSYPGLSRFESPDFYDKIRLVQQIANSVPQRLVSSSVQMLQSLIMAISFFVTLEMVSPLLAAIVTSMAVPSLAAQIAISRRRADVMWRATPATRRHMFYASLLGDRKAATELRLFGLGDFMHRRMISDIKQINAEAEAVDRWNFWVEGSLELIAAIIAGAGLFWTVRQAAAGRLSLGDVSMFIASAVGVQSAISGAVTQLADVYQSLLLLGHYEDVVSAGPDLPLAADPVAAPPLRDGIELRDVWFRYQPEHPWVLRGITMRIPHGTAAALVGLNGAGKSTIVKLICRFYDPQRGAIYWDGVDIRQMAPEELRARIGTVFQDYMMYDLTARENVGVGDLNRLGDLPAIRAAATHAGVDEKLSGLPYGYDTMLSRIFFGGKDRDDPQTGAFLSGGQWQRVALARGLMRADRDLLILDEPSSGLDAEAEHAVHSELVAMRRSGTSLLISHRLGSIRDADTILVLSGGIVTERGTHDELMSLRGEYHRLFVLQASGYGEGARPDHGPRRRPDGLVGPGAMIAALGPRRE
ncbi:MAG: ABC transporter ATP-binding protein [Streptosporangiaceae bacterium]|nr:ABC transporter ATP-binding protein [Streptosporangiaceae bacterium]